MPPNLKPDLLDAASGVGARTDEALVLPKGEPPKIGGAECAAGLESRPKGSAAVTAVGVEASPNEEDAVDEGVDGVTAKLEDCEATITASIAATLVDSNFDVEVLVLVVLESDVPSPYLKVETDESAFAEAPLNEDVRVAVDLSSILDEARKPKFRPVKAEASVVSVEVLLEHVS
jgi:hypothetical protein